MTELAVQRAITLAYVATAPVVITLTPQTKTKTGNGTTMTPGAARAPQSFKMNEPGDSGFREPSRVQEGVQRTLEYLMIGAHDVQIANDDTFIFNGAEYVVSQVLPDNGYEKRALAVRRGF